ncbi:alpha/beta-hydrolase [Mycena metata]|uniref:Dipeptidyl-peptidase V n=1 Tax=Mycena metata TaxID=1033252 RepID=A0AAD7HWI6_9AGAR|nr:alpha/beta-hydrolase [Mycena metata]
MAVTPQDIANADQINGLTLSNAGDRVVYCVGPLFRSKDAHKTQALWLADTGVPDSARQITSGLFNDYDPAFDPKSGDIFFLSDRHKAGGKAQIYRLSSAAFGGDAKPLTPTTNTRGVSRFQISPDGRWLAFNSPDEPADKDEEDKETYVITWQAPKNGCTLRILDLSGRHEGIRTVVSLDIHVPHVKSFVWSPDSTRMLFRGMQLPDAESHSFGVSEYFVSIEESNNDLQFPRTRITTHRRAPRDTSVWVEADKFHFLYADDSTSSPALCVCDVERMASWPPAHLAFWTNEDITALVGIGSELAVGVACGLESRIDVVGLTGAPPTTVLETSQDAFSSWAIKRVDDRYIFAVVRSSGVTGEAENIWFGSTTPGVKGVLSRKLSSHNRWMSEKEMPQCAPFYWNAGDGTALQGVMAYPRGSEPKKMFTVVVPHGGPYGRDTLNMRYGMHYRFLLASNGFLVLSPNYRGSQGRGNDFARAAHGGMGKLDYADVESMLAAAVERGYAHPDQVAIAGYSQGGFLAAWGCTRPNAKWKAGIIGAGPTDWGSLIICSDLPDEEADLGGIAPWTPGSPDYLQGSPIRDVKNVEAPLLLLHGQEDQRVPLTQAIGFMRGLKREAQKFAGDAATLIIYPREGHQFKERAHVEDMLTRVLAHVQKHLA